MSKTKTKKEDEYLTKVASIGCIVCGLPAGIHHCRTGLGMSQRAPHIGGTIPLCKWHHQDGGFGEAIHAGQKTWESIHGSELELLEAVKGKII